MSTRKATARTVAIIGAHGKIGLLTARALAEVGDVALGVFRKPEQRDDVLATGADGVLLDIESTTPEALGSALLSADAVVFSAGAGGGSGPERKWSVDRDGAVLAATAARRVGIRRFIQISFIGADVPAPADSEPDWIAYQQAKHQADESLRASDLQWTIIRPGRLTDEPSRGITARYSSERAFARGQAVTSREAVARTIVAALDEPATFRRAIDVVDGEQTPADALARLAQ